MHVLHFHLQLSAYPNLLLIISVLARNYPLAIRCLILNKVDTKSSKCYGETTK